MRRRWKKLIKNKRMRALFLSPFAIWSVIFVLLPLGLVVWYGLTDAAGSFTLENITVIARWEYLKALGLSVLLALIATAVCLLLAYPLCLILAEKRLKHGSELALLYVLPLWMNTLLSAMAWQTILERNGLINQLLRLLGMPDLHLINTPFAIVCGMVYNFLPYMILPLYNVLSSLDPALPEAASDLGASGWRAFWHVTLPLSVPGILSGITMVFIPALTTFTISALLGGGKILLIGNIIDQQFTVGYDWHLGSGLSVILMVFIVLNMLLSAVAERRGE